MNDIIVELSFVAYINISVAITIWVARTLSSNGLVFLIEAFDGRQDLAESINHMLVVGFYLINVGYILLALRLGLRPVDAPSAIEFLSTHVGLALLVLGGMHFSLMFVITRYGYKAAGFWSGRKEAGRELT